MTLSSQEYLRQHIDLMCCPKCEGTVVINENSLACEDCLQQYSVENDIPMMYWAPDWQSKEKDVTQQVKAFYEKTPFPNYDGLDSSGSLIQKAERSVFVKLLGEQIPLGVRILEVGCGTGQLTNFLGILNRTVIGTDICVNSLMLGKEFKEKNEIKGSCFMQMNLFCPMFKPETFDLVYCTGVLHHVGNPFAGFQAISRLVRTNGYIVIGLYHRFGRILNDIRRIIFNLSNDHCLFLDPNLRNEATLGKAQRDAWFTDQYKHPHESKYTINELLGWFEKTGFSFVRSIPKTKLGAGFRSDERLFSPEAPGNWLERRLVEYGMVVTGSNEGGYFIVIGRKNPE